MSASVFNSYLGYVAETTPGQTPATPSLLNLRTTDVQSVTADRDSFQSDEITSHGQVEDLRMGRKNVSGSIPIELSYGAFDDWLEAVLGGAWSTETTGTPNVLKIGSNVPTFTLERGYNDIQKYQLFTGVTPTTFSLDAPPDGIVTGGFDVIGMGFSTSQSASAGSLTEVASNAPMDGICNAVIKEGGLEIGIVTSLTMNLDNGRTTTGVIGSCDSSTPTRGQIAVDGDLTVHLTDGALFDKFADETESSLYIKLDDPDNNQYLEFELPRLKYTDPSRAENDNNVDITLSYMGLYSSTDSTTLKITRSNS